MKTKQGILKAVNDQIKQLQALAHTIEASESPDLRELEELPALLAERRELLNMTPAEVADLCGLSPTTYRSIERGSGNPRIQTLQTVCDALNVKIWVDRS
ncbi:helix-turn-helix transcriptional regulator [Marinobacter sp. DY40_1A1]|uniref:helix-turn-helix transcriptional regulator n=1 Tax=Marinobacter sp. DY40_1A1 TaxID=2583229 RepID=UPI0019045F22|nr:helix-turn-helix transcriptional regulator [Marinobacter sp. DY40_1A1]MBK1887796.1 helix-turn-helix transcriptional regulator [Marinobacter sp. DY40_1A1]